ncbi:MAG: hypothetical protein AB1489_09895 [Acidobacteriota bacterium]
MKTTSNGRKTCDGCGACGATLFLVRNLKELQGCLLAPKLKRICEQCREQIFLELEALKRQAARMSVMKRRRRATTKYV